MARRTDARVVVVLGASSGIGRATAVRLARRGDTLVLASRSADALAEARDECLAAQPRSTGGSRGGSRGRSTDRSRPGAPTVSVVPTDVSIRSSVEHLFDEVIARHGRIDAVVHAPAVVAYGTFEEVPAEVFDQVIQTNLLGAASVARLALRRFREQGGGHLVLVGSLLGKIATPFMSSYVTSKWGVHGLARTLQAEVRRTKGVHVSLVSPGGVDTPIYAQAGSYARREGRPPIPVDPPEKLARAIERVLDHPRRETSVGLANHVYTAGFRFVPAVFDLIVAPVMARTGLSMTPSPAPSTGNVFAPLPAGEAVHGKWGRHWLRTVALGGAAAVAGVAAVGLTTVVGAVTSGGTAGAPGGRASRDAR